MTVRAHIMIACVLAGCILFVFVSPAINLPYTTLQGSRHGALRLAMLFAVLQIWAGAITFAVRSIIQHCYSQVVTFLSADSLIDITCTRRC